MRDQNAVCVPEIPPGCSPRGGERPSPAACSVTALDIINAQARQTCVCPRCGGGRIQRWGFKAGLQRFRCTACGRAFNALTGTPLARMRRRDLWLDYAQALQDGLSIRTAARQLGIHANTTFRWRHRWLECPREHKDKWFGGVIEVDAVIFHDCRSGAQPWRRVAIGSRARAPRDELADAPPRATIRNATPVAVLVVRDRRGAMTDAVLPAVDAPSIDAVLRPLFDPGVATLCSSNGLVRQVGGRNHLIMPCDDYGGAAPHRASGLFHSRTVRGCVARLEHWMQRFRGVSTRYLANYLGWRRVLERQAGALAVSRWLHLALGRDQHPTVALANGRPAAGPGLGVVVAAA